MKKNNINFIFGLLDRKKVSLCLFIEAFLDFIYYIIPYTFALFLTMPFMFCSIFRATSYG